MKRLSTSPLMIVILLLLPFGLLADTTNSTSNSSTTTNTSNTSNNSNTAFIYEQIITPLSTLSGDEASKLRDMLLWKNSFARYDSHFDSVPKVFAPEQDYYESSIVILGLPVYIIGSVIMFIGLLFCIFRYGFGICGGRKTTGVVRITRFMRNCTLVMVVIGLTLWFTGAIISIVGNSKYNSALSDTDDSLKNEGNFIESQTTGFNTIANWINNQNLTWFNDTNQSYNLPLSAQYGLLVGQAVSINKGSAAFRDYLDTDNRSFQGFLWFFFVMGLIMSGLMIFTMIKKMGTVANILGIAYILLCAIAFGVSGVYYSMTFKVGDICEQNQGIIAQNYPLAGHGILKYVDRFTPVNERVLFEERYQVLKYLKLSSDFVVQFLNTTGNQTTVANAIQHQTDIIDLYNNGSLKFNTTVLLWGQIVKTLNDALISINDLKDYESLRRYSVISEARFCYVGMSNLYLGFVGTLIEAIAFFLLLIGGIQLKSILDKMKSDQESMINIRQAGNY